MTPGKDAAKDQLSPLEKWLSRKKDGPAQNEILPLPEDQAQPLSFGQERLWFLQQAFPESSAYHYTECLLLEGAFSLPKLTASLQDLILRHHILRSRFVLLEGQLKQIREAPFTPKLHVVDLTSLSEDQRLDTALAQAKEWARKAFDLSEIPLFRSILYKLGPEKHLLQISLHHILTDAWSMPLFWRELAQAYQGKALPALSIQYADYTAWQRKQKTNSQSSQYWETTLAGLQHLNLWPDFQRKGARAFNGKHISKKLGANRLEKIKNLAQKAQCTPFVLMTTLFQLLLSRYSGQGDVSIGTPFSRRSKTVLEPLIGFFVNSLILRASLNENQTFLAFLDVQKQNILKAFDHGAFPFEKLVEKLNPNRRLNQNPLFNCMLIYLKDEPHAFFIPGLKTSALMLDTGVAKFDISLFCYEEKNDFSLMLEYDSDLFSEQRMEKMLVHLTSLLDGVLLNPDKKLGEYTILDVSEQVELVRKYRSVSNLQYNSKLSRPFLKQEGNYWDLDDNLSGIQDWIQQSAKENLNKPALIDQNGSHSYHELEKKARHLAGYLRSKGIGPGHIVGLITSPGFEMAVGIYAILKSGAAYLPLDPDYPADRIAYMMDETNAALILTQTEHVNAFPSKEIPYAIIDQDYSGFELENYQSDSLEEPAYVIFTSGSSGKPKGVKVSQRNLLYSTGTRFSAYPVQPGRFLLMSSYSFDSSIVGIFWTLCSGGTLVIPPKRIEQDMDLLGNWIQEQRISHSLMLPSLYALVLEHIPLEKLTNFQTVIVAGEACSQALYQRHFDQLPGVHLFNEYGPTETTVWASYAQADSTEIQEGVNIGKAISGTEILILDHQLSPVPIGLSGELFVGGPGLSQGYLNQPAQTAEHFIPHPFGRDGQRLYGTGDKARMLQNGKIEFLGRVDQQIKIRGFRVEPEEIQNLLLKLPAVQEAIIQLKELPASNSDQIATDDIIETLLRMPPEQMELFLQKVEAMEEDHLSLILNEYGSGA